MFLWAHSLFYEPNTRTAVSIDLKFMIKVLMYAGLCCLFENELI